MAMTADSRGLPWNLLSLEVRGSPRKQPCKLLQTSADIRGDCRVAVAMAAYVRGNFHGSFRGNFRGNGRGLTWVGMVGTTEFATDRAAARAVDTTVVFTAVEAS